MGISFFQVSSRTPTKTGISDCKFLVPHAMCSKVVHGKEFPSQKKKKYKTQWFWKKTDVFLASTAWNPIYKLFSVTWSLYHIAQQAVGILLPVRAGNQEVIFQLYHAWSVQLTIGSP